MNEKAVEMPRHLILCVDDEPALVEGIRRHLDASYDVCVAYNGVEAMARLKGDRVFSVIVSDMRMPGMDGVTLLKEAAGLHPRTSRILLTGQADLPSAIEAINEGRLFRFLMKPCGKDVILKAVADGVRQFELLQAERELLEQTLRQSLGAMAEALSLVVPTAAQPFLKVRRLARDLCKRLSIDDAWEVEIACMFSHVATLTLRDEVLGDLIHNKDRDPQTLRPLSQGNVVAQRLTAQIPRLGTVRDLLRGAGRLDRSKSEQFDLAVWIVNVCAEYGRCLVAGMEATNALMYVQTKAEEVPERLREVMKTLLQPSEPANDRHVTFQDLRAGMVLVEAVYMTDGVLLVPADSEVTNPLIEQLRPFATTRRLVEPLVVRDPDYATVA
jgi:CheY-like chemotaxis protein